ncbi:MAG: hypothetical protein EOP02_04910 [Proteobacteria bacterium]|jgi:hypothetical protein|nr:MAG: hypothetical protein EOP02_04910 [Pseudomonadota bacterium]
MHKLKIVCALLTLAVALYSATLVVAVKINLALAVMCCAMLIALLCSFINALSTPPETCEDLRSSAAL